LIRSGSATEHNACHPRRVPFNPAVAQRGDKSVVTQGGNKSGRTCDVRRAAPDEGSLNDQEAISVPSAPTEDSGGRFSAMSRAWQLALAGLAGAVIATGSFAAGLSFPGGEPEPRPVRASRCHEIATRTTLLPLSITKISPGYLISELSTIYKCCDGCIIDVLTRWE
jgi:hypothetical protein